MTLAEAEEVAIRLALLEQQTIQKAAKALGISRYTLYRRLDEYDPDWRGQ